MDIQALIKMCNDAGFEIVSVGPDHQAYEFSNDSFQYKDGDRDNDSEPFDSEEGAARACLSNIFDKLDLSDRLALAFETAFMQPVVYEGQYFEIETSCGTEIVPANVIGTTGPIMACQALDYLEGKPYEEGTLIEVKTGFLARVSASGYMDCSDWSAHESEESACDYLIEAYGEVI